MAQTIKLRRSATPSAVPTTAQLALGELAINTYDGKLYMKKNVSGVETIVEVTGGGGGASVTVSTSAPSTPSAGDLWFDSTNGKLKVYYTDANSSQWVDAFVGTVGATGATGASGTIDGTTVTTFTGLLKGNGSLISAATANTDYLTPPSGSSILKANSGGALANAAAGTDYLAPPSGTALLKANSGGALANAVANTDYLPVADPQTSGDMGVGVATDGTQRLHVGAGTAAKCSIELVAGTLMTTPDGGSIEYDGNAFYFTPVGSQRGAVPTEQFCCTTSTLTLTSSTSLQKVFNVSTNGALTVNGSTTYFFECSLNLSSMSGTSGNMGFSIVGAGTATFTSAAWHAFGLDATTQTTAAAAGASFSASQAATGNITTAATGTAVSVLIKGIFRINAGGTIIPSIQLTTAAAAVVGVNSWFKCYPVGTNTVTNVGNWS